MIVLDTESGLDRSECCAEWCDNLGYFFHPQNGSLAAVFNRLSLSVGQAVGLSVSHQQVSHCCKTTVTDFMTKWSSGLPWRGGARFVCTPITDTTHLQPSCKLYSAAGCPSQDTSFLLFHCHSQCPFSKIYCLPFFNKCPILSWLTWLHFCPLIDPILTQTHWQFSVSGQMPSWLCQNNRAKVNTPSKECTDLWKWTLKSKSQLDVVMEQLRK